MRKMICKMDCIIITIFSFNIYNHICISPIKSFTVYAKGPIIGFRCNKIDFNF